MEEWKAIDHAPGYEVSSLGRIKSYRANKGRVVKILKNRGPSKCYKYFFVCLASSSRNKSQKHYDNFAIHRLVAEAFLPNPNNLPEVNHKDGNKLNNNVENLEWASVSENKIHAVRNGLMKPYRSSLSDEQVLKIKKILSEKKKKARPFIWEIAKQFGVTPETIKHIKSGKTHKWSIYETPSK